MLNEKNYCIDGGGEGGESRVFICLNLMKRHFFILSWLFRFPLFQYFVVHYSKIITIPPVERRRLPKTQNCLGHCCILFYTQVSSHGYIWAQNTSEVTVLNHFVSKDIQHVNHNKEFCIPGKCRNWYENNPPWSSQNQNMYTEMTPLAQRYYQRRIEWRSHKTVSFFYFSTS